MPDLYVQTKLRNGGLGLVLHGFCDHLGLSSS